MTLDEAIKHAEEVADYDAYGEKQCKCAEEHRQLAEWLKDYKRLLERGSILDKPCIKGDYYDGFKNGLRTAEWRYDKIRAEIESHIIDSNGLDFNSALCIAIEIIDKYKAESEE